MQKNTPATELVQTCTNKHDNNKEMQPKKETLQKIIQFASCYRVQKLGKNKHVEMLLN